MLEAGEWRPTATAADPHTVGYHLSALYSPVGWLSWERIARSWEAAQGSDEAMRAFRNTILGETWMETGEAPDWQRLADRREAWKPGTVPAGGLFLTAGADVQKDRIEVDVWAWGRGLESWLVDHIVLEGGPGDATCWRGLTDLLGRTWAYASGQPMTLARLAIDTGFETSAVYGWARQVGFAQVAPVSLLVAEARLNTRGRAVMSRSKTGRGVATVPVFLLVPQVRLPKRLDLAREARRAHDEVPGLIVANWVERR
jgi:phage terminase large subunit GpA-like protein